MAGSSPRARGTARGRRAAPGRFSVHPRVRGEQCSALRPPSRNNGSSPRARGTVHPAQQDAALRRFIPACAGNRSVPLAQARPQWVHPRVRGEQGSRGHAEGFTAGSSPRARGTVRSVLDTHPVHRFIPACAGNRLARPSANDLWPVHPRARGTGGDRRCGGGKLRFIPACAGNRRPCVPSSARCTVHPRVRGEQAQTLREGLSNIGSSPRARGTALRHPLPLQRGRFIPACAGNRRLWQTQGRLASVHPRVRGEQLMRHRLPGAACAVHPRVRGEQAVGAGDERSCVGSSPRARGTDTVLLLLRARSFRFIPACAGNRGRAARRRRSPAVHPRVRGEQGLARRQLARRSGSSPRARGTGRTFPAASS